jgi:hypothetical protein
LGGGDARGRESDGHLIVHCWCVSDLKALHWTDLLAATAPGPAGSSQVALVVVPNGTSAAIRATMTRAAEGAKELLKAEVHKRQGAIEALTALIPKANRVSP